MASSLAAREITGEVGLDLRDEVIESRFLLDGSGAVVLWEGTGRTGGERRARQRRRAARRHVDGTPAAGRHAGTVRFDLNAASPTTAYSF